MHRSEAFVQRLRRETGEVSSWLLVAAALAVAAVGAAAILQATIGALASNVADGAGVGVAVVGERAPGAPGSPAGGGSSGAADSGRDGGGADSGRDGGEVEGDSGRDGGTAGGLDDTVAVVGGVPAEGAIGADDGGRGGDGAGRGGDDGDDPTPVDGGDVTANGVEFTIGPYEEPEIQHDNGHLQDQSDPTNPVPEPTREPTEEEIDYYNDQLEQSTWGDRLSWLPLDFADERFEWDNAIPAYRHFLEGEGADRTFDMNAYLNDDANGRIVEQSLLEDAHAAINIALDGMATSGDLPIDEPVTFRITSDPVTTTETSTFYPYPSSTDWQRTVGGMQVWTTTEVVATRQSDGTVDISTNTTIHGEDRYNFNWNQQAIDNGQPDWLNGRLELGGLAHQYTQTGETDRSDEWTLELP